MFKDIYYPLISIKTKPALILLCNFLNEVLLLERQMPIFRPRSTLLLDKLLFSKTVSTVTFVAK